MGNLVCNTINVTIADKTNHYFVEEFDVLSILNNNKKRVVGEFLDSIDVLKLEQKVSLHPSIKNAEVYKTVTGDLQVAVWQRNPIVRVLNYDGESYYIDEDGAMMPLSKKYTARTLVANGAINVPYQINYTRNVMEDATSDELKRETILKDIYILARHISNDKFLNVLIEQLYVEGESEFKLVPKVGPNEIVFGTVENYEKKFKKLKILYFKGLKKQGWDKYNKINLKYKNQVVCTKI